jgi:drug/metabolite transporter (DMT)-like permease
MTAGIGLALVATFLFATGNILEKRAVDAMDTFSLRRLKTSFIQIRRSPLWLLGALASVLGAFVQILAYHFVSIIIVQAMAITGVVIVVVVSRLHFHESFSSKESLGLVICIVAFFLTIISVRSGGTAPGKIATNSAVEVAIAATAVSVGLLVSNKHLRSTKQDFVYGASSGIMYGLVGLSSKGLSTVFGNRAKTSALLSIWSTPYLYLMVIAWGLGLILFQNGLQQGRVGVVGPLSGAVTAIYVTAVGTPLFGENLPHNMTALILRLVGLAGILVGSLLLTWHGNKNSPKTHNG